MAADSVLEEVHSLQADVAQELKNEEQLVEQLFTSGRIVRNLVKKMNDPFQRYHCITR